MSATDLKLCPYCRTRISKDEIYVICPECGTMHHRDCWNENDGCTLFGCKASTQNKRTPTLSFSEAIIEANTKETRINATTGSEKLRTDSSIGYLYCVSCGSKNSDTNSFCGSCGQRISKPSIIPQSEKVLSSNIDQPSPLSFTSSTQQSNRSVSGFGDPNSFTNDSRPYASSANKSDSTIDKNSFYDLFVGSNADFYKARFREIETSNLSNSWNWSAAFLGVNWYLYRKLYAQAFTIMGITFVLGLIDTGLSGLSLIGIFIYSGLFGNIAYYKKAQRVLSEIEPGSYNYTQKVISSGGTSIGSVFGVWALNIFLTIMIIGSTY